MATTEDTLKEAKMLEQASLVCLHVRVKASDCRESITSTLDKNLGLSISRNFNNIKTMGPLKEAKMLEQASLVRLQACAKASDRRELHPQALFIKFSFRFLLFFCYASFFYFFYTSWQNKSKLGILWNIFVKTNQS